MHRVGVQSIVFAVAALIIGAAGVVFGWNLLPDAPSAFEKSGTMMPYYLIWGIIWLTAAASAILAAYLISNGLKERD